MFTKLDLYTIVSYTVLCTMLINIVWIMLHTTILFNVVWSMLLATNFFDIVWSMLRTMLDFNIDERSTKLGSYTVVSYTVQIWTFYKVKWPCITLKSSQRCTKLHRTMSTLCEVHTTVVFWPSIEDCKVWWSNVKQTFKKCYANIQTTFTQMSAIIRKLFRT